MIDGARCPLYTTHLLLLAGPFFYLWTGLPFFFFLLLLRGLGQVMTGHDSYMGLPWSSLQLTNKKKTNVSSHMTILSLKKQSSHLTTSIQVGPKHPCQSPRNLNLNLMTNTTGSFMSMVHQHHALICLPLPFNLGSIHSFSGWVVPTSLSDPPLTHFSLPCWLRTTALE
jgi:hypothetical protein